MSGSSFIPSAAAPSHGVAPVALPPTDGDFVLFLLTDGRAVLCEERTPARHGYAGQLLLPGGHIEPDETAEAAARREVEEEHGVRATSVWLVCALLSAERHVGWYFAVDAWDGTPRPEEAATLTWVPIADAGRLTLPMDRTAVGEYLRLAGISADGPAPEPPARRAPDAAVPGA
jgi:8-oxo-dGTP pyrophosphatase MutT (NUDIX family)